MHESLASRQAREKEFHDQTYASGAYNSRPTLKFYAVARSAFDYHGQRVREVAREGTRVLEYGCGEGSAAFTCAQQGARVTGIDISEVAIESAAERARGEGLETLADFRAMDGEALEFPDASFDLICGCGILHHTDLSHSYDEIRRTLKPGGRALFVEPLGHNRLINLYRNRTPQYRTEDEHPLLLADLEAAEDYFGDVETTFFALTTLLAFPAHRLPGFSSLRNGLERLDTALFRRSVAAKRNAWFVVMEMADPKPERKPVPAG
jgi:SAM-dependent methyltransferase